MCILCMIVNVDNITFWVKIFSRLPQIAKNSFSQNISTCNMYSSYDDTLLIVKNFREHFSLRNYSTQKIFHSTNIWCKRFPIYDITVCTLPVEYVVCVDVLKRIHHLRKFCQHFKFRERIHLLLQKLLEWTANHKTTEKNILKLLDGIYPQSLIPIDTKELEIQVYIAWVGLYSNCWMLLCHAM